MEFPINRRLADDSYYNESVGGVCPVAPPHSATRFRVSQRGYSRPSLADSARATKAAISGIDRPGESH
jgi:hypothetical protein